MIMTEMEIINLYKQAKDPETMVGILANIAGKPPAKIKEIIQTVHPADKSDMLALRERQLMALYKAGLTDASIGRRVGMSRSSVQLWRAKRGLPPNYGKSKHKETGECRL